MSSFFQSFPIPTEQKWTLNHAWGCLSVFRATFSGLMLCEAPFVAQGLENFMQGCSDHLPVGGPGAETSMPSQYVYIWTMPAQQRRRRGEQGNVKGAVVWIFQHNLPIFDMHSSSNKSEQGQALRRLRPHNYSSWEASCLFVGLSSTTVRHGTSREVVCFS